MITFDQGQHYEKPEYTKLQATRLIKQISQKGSIRKTGHAKRRMIERNISDQDILQTFKHGKVFDEPEPHIKTGNWLYKIVGNGIDNNNLSVTVFLNTKDNYLLIITVFMETK